MRLGALFVSNAISQLASSELGDLFCSSKPRCCCKTRGRGAIINFNQLSCATCCHKLRIDGAAKTKRPTPKVRAEAHSSAS